MELVVFSWCRMLPVRAHVKYRVSRTSKRARSHVAYTSSSSTALFGQVPSATAAGNAVQYGSTKGNAVPDGGKMSEDC